MITIQLRTTKTHACRECRFEQVEPGIGHLLIYEGKTRRIMKCSGQYILTEDEPTYCRRFQIQGNKGNEYWTGIGKDQTEDSCDCTGFEAYGQCKHVEIVRILIERGYWRARPATVETE